MKIYNFSVVGSGSFPFDMLRYARAWSASEDDAYRLEGRERRQIQLSSVIHPGGAIAARFASFAWQVVDF